MYLAGNMYVSVTQYSEPNS